MLKFLRARVDTHRQAIQNSLSQMLQQPFSTIGTLVVLAITLIFPTLFWTAYDNVHQLSQQWNTQGQLNVYFEPQLPAETLNALQARIHNMAGVADTRFISAQEGLETLKAQQGMADILNDLPDNPLPAATIVIPELHLQDEQALNQLQQQLQALNGVAMVKNDIEWIHKLQAIFNLIQKVAYLIIFILGIAVLLIIANTLRLGVQNRQEEIRILKLIGASDAYIIRPFVYSGILYGLCAAVIAVILSNVCLSIVGIYVEKLASQFDAQWILSHITLRESAAILLFSVLIGWLAARFSVKRELRSIKPEIYL